jgi:uncharacterized protein DUF1206
MARALTFDRRSPGVASRALRGLGPWIVLLARVGFVAKGLVYIVIALIAAGVALGMTRHFADAGGALRILVGEPFGRVLLVVVGVGLLGFAVWQAVAAALDVERRGARLQGVAARVGFAVSAFVHTVLGVDALRLAFEDHAGPRGVDPIRYWTSRLLLAPHGMWIVVLAGAVVIVFGLDQIRRAYVGDVVGDLELPESGAAARWAVRVGRLGEAARGVILLVIGGFLLQAAQNGDSRPVGGLARALRALDRAYGPLLLVAVALGLAAFGVLQILSARYRRFRMG